MHNQFRLHPARAQGIAPGRVVSKGTPPPPFIPVSTTSSSMILVHSADVPAEPVEKPGLVGMKARFLLTAWEGYPRLRPPADACEAHQVRCTGTGTLRMVCTVPLLPGKTGRETTPCRQGIDGERSSRS